MKPQKHPFSWHWPGTEMAVLGTGHSVRDFNDKARAASPLRYDAEDIEEANRSGEAVRRQHAR